MRLFKRLDKRTQECGASLLEYTLLCMFIMLILVAAVTGYFQATAQKYQEMAEHFESF